MITTEYATLCALSNSGMKDLLVSPLRYWHLWINPNKPERKETPEMKFGTALHCAVLEPSKYDSRYAVAVEKEDYPDALVTMDDLREWLKSKNLPSSGKTKLELVERVSAIYDAPVIFDLVKEKWAKETAGKTILSKEDHGRVLEAAEAIRMEPKLEPILKEGASEVCLTGRDPDTGIPLKARLDWMSPTRTLDIKTFSQQRGRSIDKSVTSAIFYEGYYRQAYFYGLLRELQEGRSQNAQKAPEFIMAFVESEAPYEVRIRSLVPKTAGNVNLYWERARVECRDLMRLYARCLERFGDKPWRTSCEIDPLYDEDMPQLAYS